MGVTDPRETLDAAVAIELIHTASLLHDDIVDGDSDATLRPNTRTYARSHRHNTVVSPTPLHAPRAQQTWAHQDVADERLEQHRVRRRLHRSILQRPVLQHHLQVQDVELDRTKKVKAKEGSALCA